MSKKGIFAKLWDFVKDEMKVSKRRIIYLVLVLAIPFLVLLSVMGPMGDKIDEEIEATSIRTTAFRLNDQLYIKGERIDQLSVNEVKRNRARIMGEISGILRAEQVDQLLFAFQYMSRNMPDGGISYPGLRDRLLAEQSFKKLSDGLALERVQGEVDVLVEFKKAAKTDRVGFGISNFLVGSYSYFTFLIYLALLILTIILFCELFKSIYTLMSGRYLSEDDVDQFVGEIPQDSLKWDDYYRIVKDYGRKKRNVFWKFLFEAASIVNVSRRYDHLYMHVRSRIDEKIQEMSDSTIFDSIATVSPSIGFFGTLMGMLYIFGQSNINIASLSGSYQFWVGLKVAVITSLWGLFDLGLSVVFGYIHRRRTEIIRDKMLAAAMMITKPAVQIVNSTQNTKIPVKQEM